MFRRAAGARRNDGGPSPSSKAWTTVMEFIRASRFGDSNKVTKMLEINPEMDVNAKDMLGNSPLTLAVKNDHFEVVGRLLDRVSFQAMREALLLSISMDHNHISEIIIGHPHYQLHKLQKGSHHSLVTILDIATSDTLFAVEISPLSLAAQRNQYEIVEMLLAMGETIEEPHHPYCSCHECDSASSSGDELNIAKTRLNAYKGLASNAYITLSSTDPIHRAFTLARTLKENAEIEQYYKADYKKLAEQLSDLTVKLLDKVRDGKELDIVLNESENTPFQNEESRMARLKMAVRYKEKLFVTHPSCQKKLMHLWFKGDRYIQKNILTKLIWCIGVAVAYPVLASIYCLWPAGQVVRLMETPVVKFVGGAISLLAFVILNFVFNFTQEPSHGHSLSQHEDMGPLFITYNSTTSDPEIDDVFIRYHAFGPLSTAISVFILGYFWHLVKTFARERKYCFTENWYHIMDAIMLILYVPSFILHFYGVFKVREAIDHFSKEQSWIALNDSSGTEGEGYLYWLDADRTSWDKWDPFYLAEATSAVANMLCLTRTTYILAYSELLGPLLISLRRMIRNVLVFMVLFLVIMIAFMMGFRSLYWYYDEEIRVKAEKRLQDITNAEESYGKVLLILRTAFFSLFGIIDADSVEIGGNYDSGVTVAVGYALFGAYNWITVIVLLNMLIAMMARSYEFIEAEKDMEWKFERSKLYLDYIKEGNTFCVPFNLIPTWWGIVNAVKQIASWCRTWCCCCRRSKDKDSSLKLENRGSTDRGLEGSDYEVSGNGGNEKPHNVNNSPEYSRVIGLVTQRFILHSTTKKEEETIGKGKDSASSLFTSPQRSLSNSRFDVIEGMARQDKGHDSLLHNVTQLDLKLQETRERLKEVINSCQTMENTLGDDIKHGVTENKDNEMTVDGNFSTMKNDVITHDNKIQHALASINEEVMFDLVQFQPIMESLRDIQFRLQNTEKESVGATPVCRNARGQMVHSTNDDVVNHKTKSSTKAIAVSISGDTNSSSVL